MNLISIFQFMMQLALLLLMAVLPLRQALAQEASGEKHKVHIKMIRTQDGKTVMVDTTFTTASHDELVKAVKAAKLDTSNLRLFDGKVRAYTFGEAEHPALRARVQKLKGDTTLLRSPGDVRMRVVVADTVSGKALRELDIIRIDGNATTIKGDAKVYISQHRDSLGLAPARSQSIRALHPVEIEQVVVVREPGNIRIDSVLSARKGHRIKIDKDEKTGDYKIYHIEADGRQVEVTGEEIGLGITGPRRAIFMVRQAKVEDATAAEKEQLKATGAPVELKAKEELKVEEISYYPNPNNGRFNLKFSLKNKGTTVVRIMDSKGDEVFVDTAEKLSGEYSREIDISPFGPGMYFLQVAQNGRYHTKKLLVQ